MKEKAIQYSIKGDLIDFYLEFEIFKFQQIFDSTKLYFKDYGFNVVEISKNEWLIKKGNIFLNPYLINPLKCKSETKISEEDSIVFLHTTLNTSGMFFTKKDIDLWQIFLFNYTTFLNNKFDHKVQFKFAKKSHLKNSLKLGFYAILLCLTLLIPFGYLAYFRNF